MLKSKYQEVTNIALKAHKVIGCRGVTRSDFKFYKGKFYLLEINTQPGMTRLSLVPEIAAYKGISFIKNDFFINQKLNRLCKFTIACLPSNPKF